MVVWFDSKACTVSHIGLASNFKFSTYPSLGTLKDIFMTSWTVFFLPYLQVLDDYPNFMRFKNGTRTCCVSKPGTEEIADCVNTLSFNSSFPKWRQGTCYAAQSTVPTALGMGWQGRGQAPTVDVIVRVERPASWPWTSALVSDLASAVALDFWKAWLAICRFQSHFW